MRVAETELWCRACTRGALSFVEGVRSRLQGGMQSAIGLQITAEVVAAGLRRLLQCYITPRGSIEVGTRKTSDAAGIKQGL